MQSQITCSGCRNLLMYPSGAPNVCCALCNAVTNVPPPGMEMAQLICGGCRTLLMYTRGATNVCEMLLLSHGEPRTRHFPILRTKPWLWKTPCLLKRVGNWLAKLLSGSLRISSDPD